MMLINQSVFYCNDYYEDDCNCKEEKREDECKKNKCNIIPCIGPTGPTSPTGPAGPATALTITPLAGETRSVSAHLVITQLS